MESSQINQSVVDIVNATASSYAISHTSFDGNLNSLFTRAASRELSSGTPPPHWATCNQKLKSVYLRAKKPDAFKEMFERFAIANLSELSRNLFADSTSSTADDRFFKLREAFPSPKPSRNEGPVVYFDLTNAEVMSVCLPIGEIYRAAVRAAIRDSSLNMTPVLVLLDFYAVLYHSLPAGDARSAIEANLKELCAVAEDLAPGTGPGAKQYGGGSSGVESDGLMGMLAKMLGGSMGGNSTEEMSTAFKAVSGLVNNMVAKVSESGSSNDPAALISTIGDAFKDPETQRVIADTARLASSAFSSVSGNLAAASAPSDVLPSSENPPPLD